MALNKTLVPLPIDGGLNTKTDPKQQDAGFLRTSENVVYETLKLFKKRNGYDLLTLEDLNSDVITNPQILTKYKKELIMIANNMLYSRSESYEKFVQKGTLYPATPESKIIVKNSNQQSRASGILVDNFEIHAWEDSSGGIRYSVLDINSKNFIVSNSLLNSTGQRPQVGHIQNNIYIFYADTTNLRYKKFNILTPSSLSAAVTAKTNIDPTDNLLHVESCQNRIFVAYNSSVVGSELGIFRIDQNDNISSTLNQAGQVANTALNITCDEQYRIIVSWSDGLKVAYLIYPLSLTASLLGPTTIETIADVKNVTIKQKEDGTYRAFYEVEGPSTQDNYVKSANLTLAGVVSNIAVLKRSLGLASETFKIDDKIFIPMVHDSDLQSTNFIIDEDGIIVTKFNNQTSNGLITYGTLNKVSIVNSSNFMIPNQIKGKIESSNGTFFSLSGVNSTVINFTPEYMYQNAYMAENLHICSGVLKMYDGNVVVEHGFHVYPETLTQSATATVGGNMSDGNYSYVAVYKWTDNNGRDHFSAPTPLALEVVLSGGTATQTVDIDVPTLRITEKNDVTIELYRTENNGTIYYKVTDPLSPTLNDTSVDSVTIVDTISDADLIARELLYTTGGVLENIAAPACYLIASHNNRLVVVPSENRNTVLFSKQLEEGKPVQFTDIIYREVDPVGGDVSGIKAMDEKLVIFCKDACFYIIGEGPNNLGQQDNFTQPEILATDIGCTNVDSIVLTPNGMMFKSRKGIWTLAKSLNMQYTGSRVEEFNDRTITSAQVVGELNQIRFICSEELALVYNYNLDRWATFTNHGGKSSITIENDYYYLREDGALYKENRSSFSDASSSIKMRIETGWLSLADLQGFQRVYHAMILGTYKSAHKLRIKVAYNFVDAYVQEVVVTPTDFIDETPYGGYSPYGAPVGYPYGGTEDGSLYQIRVDLERQKCQSIKILIEDAQDVIGEGLTLSAITFRAGLKQGEFNLPATNKYGVR